MNMQRMELNKKWIHELEENSIEFHRNKASQPKFIEYEVNNEQKAQLEKNGFE